MSWRLVTMATGAAYIDDFLCFETGPEEDPRPHECSSSTDFARADEPVPAVGRPTVTTSDPRFVFGKLQAAVANVVVERQGGQLVSADVVGDDRGYYVAALPATATPVVVIAYAANGEEVGRRGVAGDEEQPPTSWQSCGWTEDGTHVCRGGGSGSGSATRKGGVDGDDPGNP